MKNILLKLTITLMAKGAFAGIIVTDNSSILKQGTDKYHDFLFVSRIIDYRTFDMEMDMSAVSSDTPSESVTHNGKRPAPRIQNRHTPKTIKPNHGQKNRPRIQPKGGHQNMNRPHPQDRPGVQSKPNRPQVQNRPNPQQPNRSGGNGKRGGGKKRR